MARNWGNHAGRRRGIVNGEEWWNYGLLFLTSYNLLIFRPRGVMGRARRGDRGKIGKKEEKQGMDSARRGNKGEGEYEKGERKRRKAERDERERES